MMTTDEGLLSETENKNKIRCLYKDLIWAKLCYFAQFSCMGTIKLYLNFYLVSIGLTVTQAGIINGVRPLIAALCSFLSGVIIDKTHQKKAVALFFCIGNMVLLVPTSHVLQLFRKPLYDTFRNVSSTVNYTGNITSLHDARNITSSNVIGFSTPPFFFILFWLILIGCTGMPLVTVIDSSVVRLVKTFNGKASYGMQKIFAPLGFTFSSILAGFIIDVYQPRTGESQYSIMFLISLAPYLMLLFSTIMLKMDFTVNKEEKIPEMSFGKSLFQILKKLDFILLIITLLVTGVAFGITQFYLILLLEELESRKSILGFTIALSTISEILIFPFSNRLMKRFSRPFLWFLVATICYGIRLFVIYMANRIWQVMLSQILNAFCHSMLWVAVNEYIYNTGADNVKETLFTLVNITFFMIGSFVANVLGGWVYDTFGGRELFLSFGIICGIWSFVLLVRYCLVKTEIKKVERKISREDESIMLRTRTRTFSQLSLNL